MRIQSTRATLLLSVTLPSLTAALGFDCAHINVDGYKYDLSALGGVHEVSHVTETEEFVTNTTYVLNICKILKGAANRGDAKCGTSKNSTSAADDSQFILLPGLGLVKRQRILTRSISSLRLRARITERRQWRYFVRVPDRRTRPCRRRHQGPKGHATQHNRRGPRGSAGGTGRR